MTWLLVALGGALGGAARVVVDHYLRPSDPLRFPRGIFACNVIGSFLLGLIIGALGPSGGWAAYPLLGTGFCGALTTWSTFSLDIVRLIEGGQAERAGRYSLLSLAAGWCAAFAGTMLTLG